MQKPRVVFLGSPDVVVPVLDKLAALHRSGAIELVGVVSQSAKRGKRGKVEIDPPVAARAKEMQSLNEGLSLLQPEKAREQTFLDSFAKLKPDIAITAAYGQILSDEFLAIPTRATINVHPSLLPAYRGATPVQSALIDGVQESGVSVLFTVKELDAGNIITQKKTNLGTDKGSSHWMGELFKVGAEMLAPSLVALQDKDYVGTPQDDNPQGVEPSHCFKIRKSQGKLDWAKPAAVLKNLDRGLELWPGTYGFIQAQSKEGQSSALKVSLGGVTALTASAVLEGELLPQNLKPGQAVYSKSHAAGLAACGNGSFLAIQKFKPAGSKEVAGADFFNRFPDRRVDFLPAQIPVVVGVSGSGRSLRNLIALESERRWSVAGVFSDKKDCKAMRFAKRWGIPTWAGWAGGAGSAGSAGSAESSAEHDQELQTFISKCFADKAGIVCLAGFLKKFPALDLGQSVAINIHPAILPDFGGPGMYGMNVHKAVLEAGRKVSGATVHMVSQKYDQGELLDQAEVDITGCSDADQIAARVFEQEKLLLPRVLDTLATKLGTNP